MSGLQPFTACGQLLYPEYFTTDDLTRAQLMKSAWDAALLKISQERAMRRSGYRASGAHDHAQIPLEAKTNHHSRSKRVEVSLPKDQVLATLRETDDTGRMMWTDRVLWPRSRMDIQHTMMEHVHVGLVEEGGWNKP